MSSGARGWGGGGGGADRGGGMSDGYQPGTTNVKHLQESTAHHAKMNFRPSRLATGGSSAPRKHSLKSYQSTDGKLN